MSRPRYQGVLANEIPEVQTGGATVRVITGSIDGVDGPVKGIAADPTYLDVSLPPNSSFTHQIPRGQTAFAYLFDGEASFDGDGDRIKDTRLIVFGDGDYVNVRTKDISVRFLLVSGNPLNEPIARYGPFVMNTRDEIEQALRDLRDGTFVWSD